MRLVFGYYTEKFLFSWSRLGLVENGKSSMHADSVSASEF